MHSHHYPIIQFQTQQERISRVRDFCKSEQGTKFLFQGLHLENMLYFPEENLVYCLIQKTGSSTWIAGTFQKVAESRGMKFKSRADFRKTFSIKSSKHWKSIQLKKPVIFSSVRHPFEK